MQWKCKALALRCLSVLPGGASAHYWLQRYVTKTLPRSEKTYTSIGSHAARFSDILRSYSGKPLDKIKLLEFGAGRDLALAIALRARGVGNIIAVDLERLAKLHLVQVALRYADPAAQKIESWSGLARYGVEYRAPFDMRRTELAEGSLDCVLSSEVMEHIPAADLRKILQEIFRILRDGGLAAMKIDYSDHYARDDSGISRFNFLKYPDEIWDRYNSDFQFVNRLRHSDYMNMFKDAGFEVLLEEVNRASPIAEMVSQLADRFRKYPLDDIFAQSALIVARRPDLHSGRKSMAM